MQQFIEKYRRADAGRAHKIIQKDYSTHRYQVTELGRTILVAVLTTAQTSVHQLNQLAERNKAA